MNCLTNLRMTLKMPFTQIVQTSVTTNNSPSQDYTNPDDQPTTNIDSPGSQLTTVLTRTTLTWTIKQLQTLTHLGHNLDSPGSQPTTILRTTPTRTINQPQTLTHLGHNQQQSFSGLHQPGRSTNYKRWLTWDTTSNSPYQDYINLNGQPTTNIDSPGSQPTTILRTTPTRTINQLQTLTHLGHNQQKSFSGLHQPGWSTNHKHWLTWVTTKNSPSQDYTNPDDQPTASKTL